MDIWSFSQKKDNKHKMREKFFIIREMFNMASLRKQKSKRICMTENMPYKADSKTLHACIKESIYLFYATWIKHLPTCTNNSNHILLDCNKYNH